MSDQPTVFVVDDDEQARKSICALVKSMGLRAESFASAEAFLARYAAGRPGCLVTDLRMPGMSGLDLQEQLIQRGILLPVIVVTAYARTPSTVRAIQAGAVTVLDRPYAEDTLCDAISAALVKDTAAQAEQDRLQAIRSRLERLTPAERTVLDMIVRGRSNKAIAKELDISLRTVANRRREILAKMEADSTAALFRLAIAANADRS